MSDSTRSGPLKSAMVAAALLLSFALQIQLARVPDTMGDAIELGRWSDRVNELGLSGAYFAPRTRPDDYINYPPLSPQILALSARASSFLPVTMTDPRRGNADFFVKLPAILAVLGTAILLFVTLKPRAGFGAAFVVMLVYAFNPAVLFNAAYWGQLEAIFSFFILLAFRYVHGATSLAWCFATLAVLTKAHAAPFAPIVALVTLRDYGWPAVARGAAASLATTAVVLFPFIIEGNTIAIAQRMIADLSSSPLASQNGHNFWWIVSWGRWINSPGYRIVGFVLFGAIYAAMLRAVWTLPGREGLAGRDDRNDLGDLDEGGGIYLLCAVLACSFFLFMTGMHENHLFAVLPFLAMTIHLDRRLAVIYAGFTLSVLANMVLHDPFIETEYIRGGTFRLEQIYTYDLSPLPAGQLAATLLNSAANLALGIALVWVAASHLGFTQWGVSARGAASRASRPL